MPITRAQKAELIESYKTLIEGSTAIVVADYRGLTVAQMETLRRSLRETGSKFLVAKKTLMRRALQEMDRPIPEEAMIGPVGFAFLGEDIGAGAKALQGFAKESGGLFNILGGLLGDTVLDAAAAKSLANLPTREVQLAQLIGAIVGPLTSIAGLITAPHRDLVGLLQARIDKEGGEAQAA